MPRAFCAAILVALMLVGGCPPQDNGNANQNENENQTPGLGTIDGALSDDAIPARAESIGPTVAAPAPVLGQTALLNEVLFRPADGGKAFVELKAAAAGADLGGLRLRNERGTSLELPAGATAGADGLLLVRFDGTAALEAAVVHLADVSFLHIDSGHVTLWSAAGTELDRISWGQDMLLPIPLNLGGGSDSADAPVGTSIGRQPREIAIDRDAWTSFPPRWTTPGAPNHHRGVAILLPLSGFGMAADEVRLSWYPDAAAAEVRVEIARDEAFSRIVVDSVVAAAPFTPPRLAAGTYFWRVRSRYADGFEATPSPTNVLFVHDTLSTEATGDAGTSKAMRSQVMAGAVFRQNLDAHSPGGSFPSTSQRKDTFLLNLQSPRTDAGHGWDEPHVALDDNDPCDNMNCTFASTVMINNYYGGTLSQDRLTYEMRHGDATGPETDLNYGMGMWPDRPLAWALGNAALNRFTTAGHSEASFWQFFVDEIDAGRPLLIVIDNLAGGTHSISVHGYEIDARGPAARFSLIVNDPWNIGSAVAVRGPLEIHGVINRLVFAYAVPPGALAARMEEPTVSSDTDGEGVYDFDEEMRFATAVNGRDTDSDCLDDKLEIRRSVLDPAHGVALLLNGLGGDGGARTGDPPELTVDTDGGGIPDFVEDFDRDGLRGAGESDPYDARDDRRTITGTYETYKLWHPYDGALNDIRSRGQVMLQVQDDGTNSGTITSVTTDVRTALLFNGDEDCPQPRFYGSTMEEVHHTEPVRASFFCSLTEPRVILRVERADPSAPAVRHNVPITVVDECYGGGPGTVDPVPFLVQFVTGEGTSTLNGGQVIWQFEPPNAEVPTFLVNTSRHRWNLMMTAPPP